MTRPSSTKVRRECFDAHKWTDPVTGRIMLTCHICGLPIDPVREKWEAEHVIRRVLSNDDSTANVKPAHPNGCHSAKTKIDNAENNKGKRVRDKHFNIERKAGFRKAPNGFKFNWKAGRYMKAEDA